MKQADILKRAFRRQIHRFLLDDYIDVYDYVGDAEKTYIKDQTIYINADDSLQGTYEKTIKCFKYVNDNFDYDCIMRINTSVFVNIRLLYEMLSIFDTAIKIKNDETILCGDLFLIKNFMTPAPNSISMRGNTIILTHKMINILLENKDNFIKNETYPLAGSYIDEDTGRPIFGIDDQCIPSVFNIYYENKNDNMLNHIFYYKHMNLLGGDILFKNFEHQKQMFEEIKDYISFNLKINDGIQMNDELYHLEELNFLDDLFMFFVDTNLHESLKQQMSNNKELYLFRGFDYERPFIKFIRSSNNKNKDEKEK